MAYSSAMIIKETHYFTKIIKELMTDELYGELQEALVRQPALGDLIPSSGGLRKVRWKIPGKGKRGGVRVIYYWITQEDHIFMLFAYGKASKEDLTKEQIKLLRQLVEEELNNG